MCQKLFCCKLSPSFFFCTEILISWTKLRMMLDARLLFDSTGKWIWSAFVFNAPFQCKKKLSMIGCNWSRFYLWANNILHILYRNIYFIAAAAVAIAVVHDCCISIGKPIDRDARPFGVRCNFNAFTILRFHNVHHLFICIYNLLMFSFYFHLFCCYFHFVFWLKWI